MFTPPETVILYNVLVPSPPPFFVSYIQRSGRAAITVMLHYLLLGR